MPQLIKTDTNGQWGLVDYEALPEDATFLACDAEPDSAPLSNAVAIEFPAFNDGRALSLAVLLRTRLNFTGELRATGETHEDLLHYLARCGFDAIELADDVDPQVALAGITPYSEHYQGSVTEPEPIFRRGRE